MKRNNVVRFLDSQKITYHLFETNPEKRSALETARILRVPEDKVFKTIVVKRTMKGKPILAIVPGPNEVDLKALAKAVNEKKISVITEREAEQITKLKAGGISPLALINRGFQIFIDEKALEFSEIIISGGERGLNIRMYPADLIRLTQAQVSKISK